MINYNDNYNYGHVISNSLFELSYNEKENVNSHNALNAGFSTSSYLDINEEPDELLMEAYSLIPV